MQPNRWLSLTLGSVGKLMQDVNYLTSVIGQAQAGGLFTMMAGTFTQGVDTTQPIGVHCPAGQRRSAANCLDSHRRCQDGPQATGGPDRTGG